MSPASVLTKAKDFSGLPWAEAMFTCSHNPPLPSLPPICSNNLPVTLPLTVMSGGRFSPSGGSSRTACSNGTNDGSLLTRGDSSFDPVPEFFDAEVPLDFAPFEREQPSKPNHAAEQIKSEAEIRSRPCAVMANTSRNALFLGSDPSIAYSMSANPALPILI